MLSGDHMVETQSSMGFVMALYLVDVSAFRTVLFCVFLLLCCLYVCCMSVLC